jgi:23S rRNA (guanine745-N1)-methyltransferase
MRIVDAGCGEGHYLRLVESALRDPDHRHDFEEHGSGQYGDLTTDLMGFDLSKEAVTLAARGGGEIEWFVADLARIPLLDQTVDCIINIFSPANYAEFSRVLRPSGRLIKVIPGPSHVQQLRQAIAKAGLRDEAEYSNSKVIEGISEHMNIIGTQSIRATTAVNEVLLRDFMAMTPVMFHIDPEQLDLQSIHEVTVDAEVIVATL